MIHQKMTGNVSLRGGKRKLMKKTVLGLTVAGVLLLAPLHTATATVIEYEAIDLPDVNSGEDLWQYRYQVSQVTFPKYGFDIFFNLANGYQFDDLKEHPAPNLAWDVVLLPPDSLLPHDGRYDAMASVDNPSLTDFFTLNFVRRGSGTPGSQWFEVFDEHFQVLEGNWTIPLNGAIPEPGVFWLLGMGLLGLTWLRTKQ